MIHRVIGELEMVDPGGYFGGSDALCYCFRINSGEKMHVPEHDRHLGKLNGKKVLITMVELTEEEYQEMKKTLPIKEDWRCIDYV
jgi:hypothetical protein